MGYVEGRKEALPHTQPAPWTCSSHHLDPWFRVQVEFDTLRLPESPETKVQKMKSILPVLALLFAAPLHAQNNLWVTSGFVSKHTHQQEVRNEKNTGLGLEYSLSPTWAISGGFYKNSVYQRSRYLQAVWTPLEAGPVKIGLAMGVVNGYPNKGYFPTLLPVLSVGYMNMTYIPSVGKSVEGAFALQLKVKIWD